MADREDEGANKRRIETLQLKPIGHKEKAEDEIGQKLPPEFVDRIFEMIFGRNVSQGILRQWSNQGISWLAFGLAAILYSCGSWRSGVIATITAEGLASLPVLSSSLELQKVLRVKTYTSWQSFLDRLREELPVLASRIGAFLFLISALLSRGLDSIQNDRDQPGLPLVSYPHGNVSQDIVNLLLTGKAVSNAFDGRQSWGGMQPRKGITSRVTVGFLSIMEQVGQNLKRPIYPVWVVGGNNDYTVLFAFDRSIQSEDGQGYPVMKEFDVFHINRTLNPARGTVIPRMCKLTISFPAKDFYLRLLRGQAVQEENPVTTPLGYCIRTRWPGAIYNCSDVPPPGIDWPR